MGKMKEIWSMMQNGQDGVLESKYKLAVKNQQTQVYHDKAYIPIKMVQHMLDYMNVQRIKKEQDEEIYLRDSASS
jgi:hypothetical protein|tara:strand:- start:896 stop:1120 length:225 start_codon:yes stop_codon:yes gene_type:complete